MVRHTAIATVILMALSVWVLFYRLGEPNFYHLRNESRRAEIAREMIATGNWLIPQLEEETILTKPPIFYWSVALCSLTSGVTELTARIPSAVAGLGIVVFTLLLGCLLFNTEAGFISAFALLATNFFMHQARYAELECMLTFFVTAALYFFVKGYKNPARSTLWYCLFFAMMGLGMMTKGPFAMTFPLIPIIGFLVIYKEKKLLIRRSFLSGLFFFLIIVLPWPLVVLKYYPDFLKLVIWETAIRAATGFVHREPFQFYFLEAVKVFFPWVFFLPFSLWLAFSKRLVAVRKETAFLLLWFLGNLLFISLLKSKRDYYLFPITPAVALLIGATWLPLWAWIKEKAGDKKVLCQRAAFLAGSVCAGLSFMKDTPFAVNIPEMHSLNSAPLLLFIGAGMMAAALVKAVAPSAAAARTVFALTVVLMLLVHFMYFTCTVPRRNVEDSGEIFYKTVARLVGPKAPLGFCWSNENYTFTFYAHRQLTTLKEQKEIDAFMASPEKTYLVMRRKNYNALPSPAWRVVYQTDFAEHDSWKGYVLLCNK